MPFLDPMARLFLASNMVGLIGPSFLSQQIGGLIEDSVHILVANRARFAIIPYVL
jgi:hypothetical protein